MIIKIVDLSFQFHPLLGIPLLEQVQTQYHGNLLVLQEKFDSQLD
jgi:hypothetical protein